MELQRASLERLLAVALEEFSGEGPEEKSRGDCIRDYVEELAMLLDRPLKQSDDGSETKELAENELRAQAMSKATRDDVVSLVQRMESYLEAVVVELARSKRSMGAPTRGKR